MTEYRNANRAGTPRGESHSVEWFRYSGGEESGTQSRVARILAEWYDQGMKSVMALISDELRKENVRALLIGGHALSAFGYQRATIDVDCLLAIPDVIVLHKALTKAGYRRIEQTQTFAHYTHPSGYLLDVDVMLVDRATFDKLHAQSKRYRIGNVEMRVPCLPHLMALKLHAMKNNPKRELKDLADIVELLRANPGKVKSEQLPDICEREGPKNVFSKIEKHQ